MLHYAVMTSAPPLSRDARLGAIEAGGTKIVVGIGTAGGRVIERAVLPTTMPEETLLAIARWFAARAPVAALGIASFGPVQLDPAAADWGSITATTKPGWSHTPFGPILRDALGVPVGFDTDVNGAALGEARWGAARGCATAVYVTVGTGIGGGIVSNGAPHHGLTHPEMGHVRLPRHPHDAGFAGICPFHGDCLEGLASGPAIQARWGVPLSALDAGHPAHAVIAWYLGQFVATIQAMLSPRRIVLGGGVLATPGLLARIRHEAAEAGQGYFPGVPEDIIVAPGLGDNAGLCGALALAEAAWRAQAARGATAATPPAP